MKKIVAVESICLQVVTSRPQTREFKAIGGSETSIHSHAPSIKSLTK